ncbi:MAG: hypothetical protein JST26_19675 [Bacteroidetes bacterium]|nr:hypothetical protein [Bacteroidota bacterium]
MLLMLLAASVQLRGQKEAYKGYFKVGAVVNQFRPAYNDVNFKFFDPVSGVNMNSPLHFDNTSNNYGIKVELIELVTRQGFVINPFDFTMAFNAKAAWVTCGTGGGYEVTVLKRYASHLKREKVPFVKFRVGALLNYGFYENYLFSNIRSVNSNPIHVGLQVLTDKINIDLTKDVWMINPHASLSFRLTNKMDIRFMALYNLVFFSNEHLYFYESKVFYSKYSNFKSTSGSEDEYLFNASNKPVSRNIYSLAPFSFRVELSFLLK